MASTTPMQDPLFNLSAPDRSEGTTPPHPPAPPSNDSLPLTSTTNGHSSPQQSIHLVLLVHGMWGDPLHLSYMSQQLLAHFPPSSKPGDPQLDVLVATANRGNHTYDGVDWGAERVAGEFLERVRQLEEGGERKVKRVSIVGYSLGGLIARYLIGILETHNFFDRVQPCAFYTFATPHIGLPRYPSFYSSLTSTLGPRWLSRTGEQFYLIDQWGNTGRPLLAVMADPGEVFYKGLRRFGRRRVYANAAGDVTVPYVTSAIELHDPFFHYQTNGVKLTFDPDHPHIITHWELPPEKPAPRPPPPTMSWEYVQSFVPTRPVLPPHLQFSYPYNYLFYALSPLLVPFVAPLLVLAIVYRFSSAARESRRRIALLESDALDAPYTDQDPAGDGVGEGEERPRAASPSLGLGRRPTLLSLNRSGASTPTNGLERGTSASSTPLPTAEGAASENGLTTTQRQGKAAAGWASASSTSLLQLATRAAAYARLTQASPPPSAPSDSAAEDNTSTDDPDGPMPASNALAALAGEQPLLTPLQRTCANSLNELGWEKRLVLIEGVRNAHGPIICRSGVQMQGVDVVGEWVDGFEL